MKKFLSAWLAALTLTIGAAWWALWVWPMAVLDGEYPVWTAKGEMAKQCPAGTLILGDSRALAGLLPERLGPGVVNLAFGGISPVEGYFFTRRLLASCPAPRAVILSFSILHFSHIDTLWERAVKFGLLDFAELEEIRREAARLGDREVFEEESLPGQPAGRLKAWLYAHRFPAYDYGALASALTADRAAFNRREYSETIAARGQHYFGIEPGSHQIDGETQFQHFELSPLADFYFTRILTLLAARHIPVYFIEMPHNEVSVEKMPAQVAMEFEEYLRRKARLYPGFHPLGAGVPSLPWRYYGDGSHLNAEGAALWSDHVHALLDTVGAAGESHSPAIH